MSRPSGRPQLPLDDYVQAKWSSTVTTWPGRARLVLVETDTLRKCKTFDNFGSIRTFRTSHQPSGGPHPPP
eukprot:282134-Pyramimonas_sp.AAC.1